MCWFLLSVFMIFPLLYCIWTLQMLLNKAKRLQASYFLFYFKRQNLIECQGTIKKINVYAILSYHRCHCRHHHHYRFLGIFITFRMLIKLVVVNIIFLLDINFKCVVFVNFIINFSKIYSLLINKRCVGWRERGEGVSE